ncbi:MAG: hypothetical protein IT375_26325 [Polyangiaceae bacterium]|nr:hypothetical protein [Polyangiaceae bacterium]
MSEPVRGGADFGDADFEPTDEQLRELSREAFADVRARHQAALEALRTRIAALRAAALAELHESQGARR